LGKIVIIGAGMGGLAAAIRLAVAGHSVEVFEKNEEEGGKLNRLERGGFRWDTGPSLITMPFVYQELFEAAGRKLEDYISMEPVDPVCRYSWPDGTILDASDSVGRMTAALEKLNPKDVRAYFRFMAYSRRLYDLTAGPFLFNGINHWRDFLKLNPLTAFKLDPFRTVHQAVKSYFRDPHLVQLFDRYATYNGSSPYQAPATLNIIPYVELGMGGWYIRGGLYELARAYRRLAGELGVRVHFGPEFGVEEIVVRRGQAVGVRLANRQEIAADRVIANTDVAYTEKNLLPARKRWFHRPQKPGKSTGLEPSCSGFVLFLGLDRQYPQLAHHNIFFSQDYAAEFDQIFNLRQPPFDPTIYVCWTGLADPQHAPAGKSNLFVLVNVPYLSEAFDWEAPGATRAYRDLIVKHLENFGLAGLSAALEVEECLTPVDLARRYNADRGAIYGVSSNSRFSAFLRPPNRSRHFKNLYYVGGSTHPGGGVPLVTLSAKIVAGLIAQDEAKRPA
jgi:diapolycopene oxygenase